MKPKKFVNRFESIAQEAHTFIKEFVKGIVILASDEELEADEDLLYELPIVTTVNKYDLYDEFAVLKVEKKDNGDIVLHTQGKGENDSVRIFDLIEIDNANVCYLADTIIEKL